MTAITEDVSVAQDFRGLIVDVGPVSLPPGAHVEQTNIQNYGRGTLLSRPGLRPVEFEDDE